MSTELRLAAIEARLAVLESRHSGATHLPDKSIADDGDLDGPHGDPVVKRDPKRWLEQGHESYAGCRMSQCPSDYLRMLASLFDWMASKDEQQNKTYTNKQGKEVPTAPFNRNAAMRARGWAKRNEGKAAAVQPQTSDEAAQDEIPF